MFLCLHKKNYITCEIYQYTTIFVFRHVPYRISGFSDFSTLCPVFIHTTQSSDIVYSTVDDDYTSNPEITRQK
jgi:hypothetical protein